MAGSGRVRTAVTNACTNILYHLGMFPPYSPFQSPTTLTRTCRFVIKTKEQRAAEKALLDKSPLATLTLEDFLESERHKLSGTLTPVTPESFAKWKKERLDKRAAEDEARKAKDATGRALFESGNWKTESDDEESDEESEDDESGEKAWNLDRMRKETERLQMLREDERLKRGLVGDAEEDDGQSAEPSAAASVNGDEDADGPGKDEGQG